MQSLIKLIKRATQSVCSCRSGYRAWLEIMWALPAQVRILPSTHFRQFCLHSLYLFWFQVPKRNFFLVLWVRWEVGTALSSKSERHNIYLFTKISLQFPRSKLLKFWSLSTFTIFWWHVQVEGCEPVHEQKITSRPLEIWWHKAHGLYHCLLLRNLAKS